MSLRDKILLRKRSVIETINDKLKNICQIEHSRHRGNGKHSDEFTRSNYGILLL